ncbi:hypothetical protein M1M16_gp16 [Methanobacterium virus Drs3]|uniref:Uncharacterized protein n=1 Tax=Methanobacterium virus Drs3 TaxID=1430441 RepID=A0A385AGX6_9CAUD|nr:hypothetical protein M1M16_gp16 [Methanobacterium virus Drs3]AXN53397.1 hypothetical protein Drs3_00016 [Methanobacterium virus Drs3]
MLVMWNILFKEGRVMIGDSQGVGILKKMAGIGTLDNYPPPLFF